MKNPFKIPYLIVRLAGVLSDTKLFLPDNNGRKFLVNRLRPEKEVPAKKPLWKSRAQPCRTPVVQTGKGGLEVATFSQAAKQVRHKHLRGTECYTVLKGRMAMRLDNGRPVVLRAGDELIVFPGTAHEILNKGKFLARVHSIDCFGNSDKYVKKNGTWVPEI
jgi:quercetin dioxygenase-like cupin family protein